MRKITYTLLTELKGHNKHSVTRGELSLPENSTTLDCVKLVKKELGLTGAKCDRSNRGNTIVLSPRGHGVSNLLILIDL